MSDTSSVENVLTDIRAVEPDASAVINGAEQTEDLAAETEAEPKTSDKNPAFDDPKVKTAIRNRDRKLSKARERIRELESFKELMQKQLDEKRSSLKAPDESQFTNYGDLVEAKAVHAAEKKIMAAEEASQNALLENQSKQAMAMRDSEIAETEIEFGTVVSDYQQTVSQNVDVIRMLPPKVTEMLRDLDNPSAAVYVLAKEGKLMDLAYMNPQFAAVALMQAQERGEGFFNSIRQQKSAAATSKAPEPMRGARGTGSAAGKSLESMNAHEIVNWLKS